ncbi:conserved hypothetical protein [Paraburkholderia unamae]|uniref:DUF4160 domain-containing protein n=1 Tax=Paraburkholderia unamae TaxID=219649 RepID=UPI001CB19554|nr:DUF4160 domain-containing protein [Paraburkholderia unamae]CAG9273453.1 conserved hypothetical protein [Paraburkholderia unamae]
MDRIRYLLAVLRARLGRPQLLDEDLASLRDLMSAVDYASATQPTQAGVFHKLVMKRQQIKIKMYQEAGHSRPHFHVDYGPYNHVAVYAVDTGERLEGNLNQKYDKAVCAWAIANRPSLLAIWRALQSGEPESPFAKSLSAL